MSPRPSPVYEFTERATDPVTRRIIDMLHALFGKVTSVVDVLLFSEPAAYTVVNAAATPGTSLGFSHVAVDFADAFIDQVRVVVTGANSGAGSVIVTVHDVTNNVELCRVTVTGAVSATWIGAWTTITPTGSDQEIELRCIGNGADDPFFYNAHCQGRTLQARA